MLLTDAKDYEYYALYWHAHTRPADLYRTGPGDDDCVEYLSFIHAQWSPSNFYFCRKQLLVPSSVKSGARVVRWTIPADVQTPEQFLVFWQSWPSKAPLADKTTG